MSELLTVAQRKAVFKKLGYGYTSDGMKKFQKEYMLRKEDVDGKYGKDTDNTLRTVWNVRSLCKNFSPKEFRCDCGGRFCCGYPDYMKSNELKHIQAIRTHYGKPITITQGLRCKGRNAELKGSVVNSGHLTGRAVDFYQKGVTDTLANRKKSISWIKKQANHKYSYGDGINSYGLTGKKAAASYMGNALHTETSGGGMATLPKTTTSTTTTTKTNDATKIINACKAQAKHMQNAVYAWDGNPTIANSEKKGTCVTYIACVLQRLGYLKSGKFIWHNENGKVTHATDDMVVTYPSGPIKSLKSKLKAGDIIIAGKANDVGAGSHIFIFNGTWTSKDDPYIWDNHSAEYVKKGKTGLHSYSGSKNVIALIRLKNITTTKTDTTKKTATTTKTNADKLVAMAKALAWPKGTASSKYKYPSGSATKAFKAALPKAYPNRSSWSAAPRAGASCDVFVGTCVRYSGVDSKFPRGLSEQMPYKSSKFTRYVYKNVAPKKYAKYGDVIMYTHSNGTHIIIKGDGCYYEANYKKKYGHVNTTSRLGDKMKKVIILRPKG